MASNGVDLIFFDNKKLIIFIELYSNFVYVIEMKILEAVFRKFLMTNLRVFVTNLALPMMFYLEPLKIQYKKIYS